MNNKFAAAAPQVDDNYLPTVGFNPPNTLVTRLEAPAGVSKLYARFIKGRVRVEIQTETSRPLANDAIDVLRLITNKQFAKLPATENLTDKTTISIRHLQLPSFITMVAAIILSQLIASALSSAIDRGTREKLFRRLLQHRPSRLDPRVVPPYLTEDIRRRRRLYRTGVVLRILVLIGIFTATFSWTTLLEQIAILSGCAVLVALLQVLIARRPRGRTGRLRTAAISVIGSTMTIALAGSGAILLWIRVTAINITPDGMTEEEREKMLFLLLAVGVLLLTLSDLPYRLSRRLSAKDVAGTLEQDSRREILLLRSFLDDSLRLRSRRTSRQPLLQRLTFRRRERFEELVAWSLWKLGPPVTLGEPGTRLPRLGAVRQYFSDDTWEDAVACLIQRCSLIVVVVGRSPSLVTEINLIRANGCLSKCLFVIPPRPPGELRLRMQVLTSALDLDPSSLPTQDLRNPALLAMSFDEVGTPELYLSSGRDDISYQAAIESAAASKVDHSPRWVTTPAAPVYHRGTPINSLLRTSPPQQEIRRTRWKRRLAFAPFAMIGITIMVSTLFFVSPEEKNTPPIPGTVIARATIPWLAVDKMDRIVGANAESGDIEVLPGNRIVHLPDQTARLFGSEGRYYAVTTDQRRIIALPEDETLGWQVPLTGFPGHVVESHGRVFISVPGNNEVVVLDAKDGRRAGSIPISDNPYWMTATNGTLIVGQISGPSFTVVDTLSLKIKRSVSLPFSPASLATDNGSVFISSVEGSSLVEYSLADLDILRSLKFSKNSGIFAVGPSEIVAATYGDTSQILRISRRTFKITSTVESPGQLRSVISIDDSFYCTSPDMRVVFRLPR